MLATTKIIAAALLTVVLGLPALAAAEDLAVGITPDMSRLDGTVNGRAIVIVRDQNQKATVDPAFAKTSRKCPPFCIQPSHAAAGIDTIGELEVIDYVRRMAEGDSNVMLIDSRTSDWVAKGTIPGAVNIPWTKLNPAKGASPIDIADILSTRFGAQETEGLWDFSNAKTLVLFCNGMWCGQSPNNIKSLLRFGYPADKIKWYRGGMQDWAILGLSTVKP